ncbi:lysozyme inhibitor LprI family protein [Salaquimonas pukyongi]|uniref:lysozyme inhibitor LprI family protein n=1 Tax=Salaquimonas pukyongi TaxID=2712698 RepID=UPI00096B8084|nr:hypothetical protein [Salaquimonas pukyongi]
MVDLTLNKNIADNNTVSPAAVLGQAFLLPAAICVAGVALFWSLPAEAQSFPCAEAEKPAEFAVCNNENLLSLDERLSKVFQSAYGKAGTVPQRQSVTREHNEWLKVRNACGADFTCLDLRYREHIDRMSQRGA